MGIWVVWNPDFTVQGLVKLMMAAVSVGTAIALWPLLPRALAVPSPAALREANRALEDASAELQGASVLLRTVIESQPVGVAYFDHDNRLQPWNARFETQFMKENTTQLMQLLENLIAKAFSFTPPKSRKQPSLGATLY